MTIIDVVFYLMFAGVSEEDVTSIPMTKINEVKAAHTLDILRVSSFSSLSYLW